MNYDKNVEKNGHLKFFWNNFYRTIMFPKVADGLVNIVDPDQIGPWFAVPQLAQLKLLPKTLDQFLENKSF